ncbi:hypothetical protein [Paraburkholderia adhaesiva]|uniref:hypothetical protein n=1 Tax=Paraburkholderia adhaesiva TaxID=2883244 RepID=UPI001F250B0B|nr:hypothetical protein [Paraburkholderia adhaesiva]
MDYTGTGRTNYVTVIDVDGLLKAIEPFNITFREHSERKGTYAFFDSRDQGWPAHGLDGEGKDIDLDIGQTIMPFVAEGEVLVMMDCGSEGDRYVGGWAQAWLRRGDSSDMVTVGLHSIYDLASQKFGVAVDQIGRAEY